MILNKIDDPRDNLEKARRRELVRFAHAHGLNHITHEMPAILVRRELRSKGLTNIKIPPRVLGSANFAADPNANAPNAVEVSAADDLARQFKQQAPPPPEWSDPPAPKKKPLQRGRIEINALRDQCKALGIKLDRRDKMVDLRRKLADHGKNTVAVGK